jgi:hypothetical protein
MIVGRRFVNDFSSALNSCNEDVDDGVYFTIRRFYQLLDSLNNGVDNFNKAIIDEISGENEDIALSILNQEHVVNNMYFFKDMIAKSLVVSIYSYLEFKLGYFAKIVDDNLQNDLKIRLKYYESIHYINKVKSYHIFFLENVIPELSNYKNIFEDLVLLSFIRNCIVHKNSSSIELRKKIKNIDRFKSIELNGDTFRIINDGDLIYFIDKIEFYLGLIISLTNRKFSLIEKYNLSV